MNWILPRGLLWACLFLILAVPNFAANAQGADAEPATIEDKAAAKEPAKQAAAPDNTAKPPLIPTSNFAARPIYYDAEISPDGKRIAFRQFVDKKWRIVVVDADSREVISTSKFAAKTRANWLRWAGNDKLLISASMPGLWFGSLVSFKRLVLHYPETEDTFALGPINGVVDGDDVVFVEKGGNHILVSVQKSVRDYPSVFRYELKRDGELVEVQKPKAGVWLWYADETGVIRLGMGWKRKKLHVWYRSDGESKFERIGKIKEDDSDRFLDVVQIVSGTDQGYSLEESETGRVGVRLFDYTTREVVETFYENPDWDVEEFWIEDGKPVAAFYTDDRRQVVWFDDEYKEIYDGLKAALKTEQPWVTSWSEDSQRLLVFAGSAADPGVLYLYDRKNKKLDELSQYRPEIDFRQLAQPKAFTYTARDGTDIRAFLTLPKGRDPKNLPLIIHPHGGPFGIRDQLRYDDQVQFLANRGYAVIQPNFRGSGGYGDAFYDLGVGQVGRGMQDDLDDAMDWAVAEGIADPARVCVIGGSYGGYAALWAVLRNPERYRCAASWAGVTDWDKMLSYDRRYLTRKAGKRWTNKIEGDDKELDLKDVSPYRLASQLNRPVLLAHGTLDDNVPIRQFDLMKKASAKAPIVPTTLVIKGEGHGFSKAESEQKWYDALDSFLAEHNPSDVTRKEAE